MKDDARSAFDTIGTPVGSGLVGCGIFYFLGVSPETAGMLGTGIGVLAAMIASELS